MFYILTFLLGALIVYLWLKAQNTKELGQLLNMVRRKPYIRQKINIGAVILSNKIMTSAIMETNAVIIIKTNIPSQT